MIAALMLMGCAQAHAQGGAPAADRQSADHQLSIARTARAAGTPAPVAEALATAELLSAGAAANPEIASHRQWLAEQGTQLYAKAMTALDAKDYKTAVKSYLVAVKCDASILGRDDRGLRDASIGALRRMADKHPEKPALRFQVGYYSWLFGDLPGAQAALDRYQAEESDPHKRWRGQMWRQRITFEHQRMIADERAAAVAAKARGTGPAEPTATSAEPRAGGAVATDADTARDEMRKKHVQEQIAAIDAQITELQTRTKGETFMQNGQLMVRSWNQKEVKARIDELTAKKTELEGQL